MRIQFLFVVLLVSVGLPIPRPTLGQSFNYAEECATSVDNATIRMSASDSLQLPDGHPVEKNDTLAAYTARGTCAGYGVWGENGATFATADSTNQEERGYLEGESLKFEVFDVSSGTAVDVDSSVTYTSCSEAMLSLCRDDGRYANGTIHQVASFSSEPLPVKLIDLTATLDGTTAILKWRTASEINNAGFGVQHQAPGEDGFTEVAFVQGAGTTDQPKSYQGRVEDLRSGSHQFRLRQTDTDGSAHTTDPVTVNVEVARELALRAPAPHPVRRSTRLAFTVGETGPVTVALYNVLGQRVRDIYDQTAQVGSVHELKISADGLSSGTYFVRLNAPSGTKTRRITVVR
jgi:hypothetical protein